MLTRCNNAFSMHNRVWYAPVYGNSIQWQLITESNCDVRQLMYWRKCMLCVFLHSRHLRANSTNWLRILLNAPVMSESLNLNMISINWSIKLNVIKFIDGLDRFSLNTKVKHDIVHSIYGRLRIDSLKFMYWKLSWNYIDDDENELHFNKILFTQTIH